MLDNPKYKNGDRVQFVSQQGTKMGVVEIVDAYGSWAAPDDPSYDILVQESAGPCLYKHVAEQYITLLLDDTMDVPVDEEALCTLEANPRRWKSKMKPELEQQLKNDFEFLRTGSPIYGDYDIEVLDGWYDLLYKMCTEVQTTGGDFEVRQIKQKYGRLRVYYLTSDPRIEEIVDRYETLSETVCEECGRPGVYRKEHIIVLCDECTHK